MKKILTVAFLLVGLLAFSVTAEAKTVHVRGYVKPSTGTYVAPHYKTSPNRSRMDNYSTRGNYNPYTGRRGTVSPYKY